MKDNFIQLGKSDVLTLKIKDVNGKETGEYLTFDLEDIELPLKYQELIEKHRKNLINIRNQISIIEKREDVKGKKLLSKNEEDKIHALNDFFKKEAEIYNIFLGERGVEKLLNGRKLGWTTLSEIDELIEKQILPYFKNVGDNIKKKIQEKYGQAINKNKEVLTIDE